MSEHEEQMNDHQDSHERAREKRADERRALPPMPAAIDPQRKSPLLAAFLSLMPGLGQVYTGYYQRGFVHLAVAATTITLLASGEMGPLIPLAGLFLAFFWLYNVVDAWRRAALINEALAGRTAFELPADMGMPGFAGSVPAGATIAAIGTVLLLHTRFDMSLDWIDEWWPVALILFGGYLIWKAKQDQSKPAAESDEY